MSVRDLSLGQLDVIFHGWLGEASQADFASDPRLGAWRPAVEAALAKLRTTSDGARPDFEEPTPSGPTPAVLDRIAEAAIRTLGWAMSAAEQAARAAGDTARADQRSKAFSFVFDRGMRFLSAALPEQVGETRRLVVLARHDSVRALMEGTTIAGANWTALVDAVEGANKALEEALAREVVAIERGPSARLVRVESLRLANIVAQTAETVLPADVAARFLGVFQREVGRAAARRATPGTSAGGADLNPDADDGPDMPVDVESPAVG